MGKQKKKPWKVEEIQFLLNNWNKLSLEEIIKILDRTVDSVTRKARRLGLDTKKPVEEHIVKKWIPEEDDIVIKNYSDNDVDMSYIKSCFSKFTITMNDSFNIHSFPEWLLDKIEDDKNIQFEDKDWTTQEVRKMFSMKAEGATYRQIAHSLGRTISSVKTKIYLTQKQQLLQHSVEAKSVAVI